MALRKLGKLIRVSTKAGLAGGTIYLYYETGLWKGTDETIDNYEKLQQDVEVILNANPDAKKWANYISSSVKSSVKPYTEAVTNFRKEWLNYDLSAIRSPINGIVKPVWNKGIEWTCDAVANSPETLQKLGTTGWQKITESLETPPAGSGSQKPADSYTKAKQ